MRINHSRESTSIWKTPAQRRSAIKENIQRMARVWRVSKKKINSAFLPTGCMSEIFDFFFVYFLFDLMWQRTVGKGVTSLSWGVISVYSFVYPHPLSRIFDPLCLRARLHSSCLSHRVRYSVPC